MAVEDIARAAPITSDACGDRPSAQAAAKPRAVEAATCANPKPKISVRIRLRRSNDSSSPMANSSATTPKAAMVSTAAMSPSVNRLSAGAHP